MGKLKATPFILIPAIS